MQRFLIRLSYFILPVAILIYPLDVFISTNLKKSNGFAKGEYSTWNDIIDGKINSDIVIHGSSRAWVHVDPNMLADSLNISAYNLGIDGQNFGLQYLRHRLLLKYNQQPRLVIHSLDVFTFQKKDGLYNAEQFLPYMLWDSEIDSTMLKYQNYGFLDCWVPLVRYYGKFSSVDMAMSIYRQSQGNPPLRIRGYQGQDLKWNSDLEDAKRKGNKIRIDIDSSLLTTFEKYLEECKERKIDVILIYTPEYIEGQDFVENRKQIISIYKYLSCEFNVPFYDFSNDELSLKKEYFYNASHLNKIGSVYFTERLIDSLKQHYIEGVL
jgi:hypothetical protein